MADPYRSGVVQQRYLVTVRRALPFRPPYNSILCSTVVWARDEQEAVEIAVRGHTGAYKVVEVVPSGLKE